MDIKTLEYMQERVDKGLDILKKIKDLKKQIEGIQRAYSIDIVSNGKSTYLDLANINRTKLGITFKTKAFAVLSNTFIDLARKEIELLEKEFAEL